MRVALPPASESVAESLAALRFGKHIFVTPATLAARAHALPLHSPNPPRAAPLRGRRAMSGSGFGTAAVSYG